MATRWEADVWCLRLRLPETFGAMSFSSPFPDIEYLPVKSNLSPGARQPRVFPEVL